MIIFYLLYSVFLVNNNKFNIDKLYQLKNLETINTIQNN